MAGFYEPLLEDQYEQIFRRKLAKFNALLNDLNFCTGDSRQILHADYY